MSNPGFCKCCERLADENAALKEQLADANTRADYWIELYQKEGAASQNVGRLRDYITRLIADDSIAITYQTLGQYRSMLLNALAKPTEQPAKEIAKILHYPEHWDTAAYPTLDTAIIEALGGFVCSDESHWEQPQGERR